jgi:anti-sigma regulatory factor (Ser/Thr protein kinase)
MGGIGYVDHVEADQRRVDSRHFAPRPASAAEVRSFLRDRLSTADPRTQDALWLASEIATNAVLHARSPFQLTVEVGPDVLRVAISDDNPTMPVVAASDSSSTSGRGLSIIEAVADRWGVESAAATGKTVWFELTRRP